MKARDIMTVSPAVVTPDVPVYRAAEIMRDIDVGLVPVVDDLSTMRVVGVITDRDIVVRCVAPRDITECLVRDHMTTGRIDTVKPDADVSEVVERMAEDRIRRILVVDDGGRLVGIIAQADVATKLGPTEPLEVEHLLEQVSEPVAAIP